MCIDNEKHSGTGNRTPSCRDLMKGGNVSRYTIPDSDNVKAKYVYRFLTGMTSTFRVFLGAPTAIDLHAHKQNEESAYQWQTVSSKQCIARTAATRPINTQSHDGIQPSLRGISASLRLYSEPRHASSLNIGGTQSVVFPLATLEAASRRISLIYENIIFDESADDEEYVDKDENNQTGVARGMSTLPWLLHLPLMEYRSCRRNNIDNMATNSTRGSDWNS
jgi:hypothetical protein